MQHVFIFTAARWIHFRKNGTIFSVPDPESKLYHGQLGIKPLKLKDVRELAQKYVPPDCMSGITHNCQDKLQSVKMPK